MVTWGLDRVGPDILAHVFCSVNSMKFPEELWKSAVYYNLISELVK